MVWPRTRAHSSRLPIKKGEGGVRERGSQWYPEVAFLGGFAQVAPHWKGTSDAQVGFAGELGKQLSGAAENRADGPAGRGGMRVYLQGQSKGAREVAAAWTKVIGGS